MNHTMRRSILAVTILVAVVLAMAGCQRERPAAEDTGDWNVSPVGQPAGTPVAATPGLAPVTGATTVSVQGGQLVTPVPGTPLAVPTSAGQAAPEATPGGQVVVPVGPTTTYAVQAGDTLFAIALQFNTDVDTLRRLNNLSDDTLQVGQQLVVPAPAGQETQPGTAAQTPPAGAQITYVVRSGDTLSAIGARFGVAWQDIAAANNISGPNYNIYRGQQLVIPGVSATPTPATPSRTHTVQSGETLYSIAVQYGTTVQAILEANNLSDPNLIYKGQVLTIPGQ